MVPPNSTILRRLTALFSIVLLIFAAVSLYTTTSAAILVDRFLNNGRYAWAVVLMTSGEDRPGTQYMDLTYDSSSEIYLWVAAGSSLLASLLCIAKTGFDDWSRRRRDFDGMVRQHHFISLQQTCELTLLKDHILPASRFSSLLSYTTASWILTAFTSTLVSAIYTWKHRLVVQQTTCHLELVKQPDALFRCTRELAVCDISPYLLKSDTSEHARVRRQEACGQLVRASTIAALTHQLD
jgi:hypothetical protein